MNRQAITVAVAILLVLAGCGGGGGGGGGDGTAPTSAAATTGGQPDGDGETADGGTSVGETEITDAGGGSGDDQTPTPRPTTSSATTRTPTATPQSTTTTPPTLTPGGGLPQDRLAWANRSGINMTALLIGHIRTIANRSGYEIRADRRLVSRESNFSSTTRTIVRVSYARQRALYVVSFRENGSAEAGSGRQTEYRTVADGDHQRYVRYERDGNVSYDAEPEQQRRSFAAWARSSMFTDPVQAVLGIEFEYAGTVTRDGRTLYRLRGTGFREDAGFDTEGASNLSATLLVDRQGIVRSLRFAFDTTSNDVPIRFTYDWELVTAGATTVEEPDWLDEARNASDG